MARQRQQPKRETNLTLESLGDLANGAARVMIDAALRTALRDVEDRGSDGKPRKVTIEIEMKKVGDSVGASVKAKTTSPPYATGVTIGRLELDGSQPQMKFNPHSADVDQPTLVDEDEPRREPSRIDDEL